MSLIKPFKALRPRAEKAKQVACGPYDVIHDSEARAHIEDNRLSFLRVTRPESEFADGSAPSASDVLARAKANLEWFIEENIYQLDAEDAIYVYQLVSAGHSQTGVVACCSLDEYERGLIKKHENVRPDKVEDRAAHMLAVRAQTGLIFLAFKGTPAIEALIGDAVKVQPLYDFVCSQGTRQLVWRITATGAWVDAFSYLSALYVADGHHRIESAKLARDRIRAGDEAGSRECDFVVAGMFPAEDLQILPYNRFVRGLNGLSDAQFIDRLRADFDIEESGDPTPAKHGEIAMYLNGRWLGLRFDCSKVADADPIERLDVSILQDHVLAPVLGIKDPTTDQRIGFVGGARGSGELERLVDSGEASVAFSLYPTTMDDLFTASDMGRTMPPKSTWFEPKLKDGLLIHVI